MEGEQIEQITRRWENEKLLYTYDMIEIHPRPTYNLFDNYTPTATVYMNLHGIETFHSGMALHSNLLQIKRKKNTTFNKEEKNRAKCKVYEKEIF